MERISELLDEYGWAEMGETRRKAILAWMNETTNRILELNHKVDVLMEAHNQHTHPDVDA